MTAIGVYAELVSCGEFCVMLCESVPINPVNRRRRNARSYTQATPLLALDRIVIQPGGARNERASSSSANKISRKTLRNAVSSCDISSLICRANLYLPELRKPALTLLDCYSTAS